MIDRAPRPDTRPALTSLARLLEERLDGSVQAVTALREQLEGIQSICAVVLKALRAGGTLYAAGNGGSAAQAMHLTEELIGRYRADRPPLRAICLNSDAPALTCIANDFGYPAVFARQCQALLGSGDVLIVLTTSGRSENIREALQVARTQGAKTLGLLGGSGGACLPLCDQAVLVPGTDSAHIQEAHQVIIHLICEAVERGTAVD